jgi:RNA polymerase primary sigma factor
MEMVTMTEEEGLSERIREGDQKALEQLVKANLRFVVSVAKQYQGNGLSLSDLINEGNIGLMKAAQRFDESRGFKFISYAVWHIRQSILQAIREHGRMIRLPQNKSVLRHRVRTVQSTLEQQLGRMPSEAELAEALSLDEDDIKEVLGLGHQHVSLDAPVGDEDDSGSLIDTLRDHNSVATDKKIEHRESLQKELLRSMQTLNTRQQQTLCYLYGIGIEYPMSLEDIARKFDLTPERVRQIKEKALLKIRMNKNFTLLQHYLGS